MDAMRRFGVLFGAVSASLGLAACGGGDYQRPAAVVEAAKTIPEKIDYNWDVRPILSNNCFRCHGNDAAKRKAGLRLDIAKNAYAPVPEDKAKRAIVPGNPGRSELLVRITSTDPDVRMPPKDTHKTLSATEIAILEKWIKEGAKYKQHWAYIAPKEVRPKATPWDGRAVNPIDRYIFERVKAEGLAPSPEADRETLINRVTLDLTGLPPTLREVDAFVADKDPKAYEHLVDRLLNSRQYAERQTNIWLDVARYADSDGFQFDHGQRLQFPYRDWVISAFQRNMPYDKFVTWQLAGDKLPKPTREQILATSFARLGKRSNEMGIIDEEYRVEYGLERTELIGKAFLGLTVGCAKCHDHKYDVISQKDFYSMYGFFNQIDERGVAQPSGYVTPQGPTLAWPTPMQAAALAAAQKVTAAKDSAYRAAIAAARADATAKVQLIAAADRVRFLQAATARGLQAYYPFEAVYKAPFEGLFRGRDGVPAVLKPPAPVSAPSPGATPQGQRPGLIRIAASAGSAQAGRTSAAGGAPSPPPIFEDQPLGRGGGLDGEAPQVIGKPDPGLPRLAGIDLRRASAANPPRRPNALPGAPPPPPPTPALPTDLTVEKLFWTPSGQPGGKPGGLHNAKFVAGPKGRAVLLEDTIGFAYPGVGFFERTDPFSLDVWVKLRADKPYEEVNLLHNRSTSNVKEGTGYELQLVDNRLRFRLVHSQPYNSISILSRSEVPKNKWVHLTATYDGESKASGLKLYVDGQPLATDIEQDHLTRTSMPKWAPAGAVQTGTNQGFSWGMQPGLDEFKGGAIDEVKVFTRTLTPTEVALGHDPSFAAKTKSKAIEADVTEILVDQDPRVVKTRAALTQARLAEQTVEAPIYQLMVLKDRALPRKTYVLQTGLYNAPKKDEEVKAQGLDQVFKWRSNLRRDRLGLTQWLFDKKNPLTARVFVNRMWQGHFGSGIVDTVEDFGTQGSKPTHPELLDWLAIEFQRSGWDIRHMHKLMVMSATYRQTSNLTPKLIEKDPRNFVLARGPRFRMPAELIRDNALFASGLLIDRPGGDAVFPYQPEGVWASIGVPAVPYPNAVPADEMHRRSMYTYIRRNAAYPSLTVFDMPDRNVSTVARRISNTPLQALVLMNDVQYLEAYRKLAERAIKASPVTDQQLTTLFRLATRRHPVPAELATMKRYLTMQTENMRAAPQEAERLLAAGVAPRDPALDPTAVAAMTMVTSVVMNTPDAYSLR